MAILVCTNVPVYNIANNGIAVCTSLYIIQVYDSVGCFDSDSLSGAANFVAKGESITMNCACANICTKRIYIPTTRHLYKRKNHTQISAFLFFLFEYQHPNASASAFSHLSGCCYTSLAVYLCIVHNNTHT